MGRVEEVIKQLKKGDLIILVDDVDTHASYFMGLAETVTGDLVNFMATIGRGLIYVSIDNRRAKQLNLTPMDGKINSGKNFTISIDHQTTTTGISAFERANTIQAVTNKESKPEDFKRPGHIFPLVYSDNGLLDYMGIVEASADLAKLSSHSSEFTYLCEILNNEGGLASSADILEISQKYGIPKISITEVFKSLCKHSICSLEGQVVHGQKIGRKLGYPTANLDLCNSNIHLRNGVYGVKVNWQRKSYFGVMNVGVKPTINNHSQKSYEVHILDFNQSIYEEKINIEVKFFIRDERKFNSLNQLTQQIERDIEEVKNKFELQELV